LQFEQNYFAAEQKQREAEAEERKLAREVAMKRYEAEVEERKQDKLAKEKAAAWEQKKLDKEKEELKQTRDDEAARARHNQQNYN